MSAEPSSSSPSRLRLGLLLLSTLASCASSPSVLEAPEGRIVYLDEDLARQTAEYLSEFQPEIRRELRMDGGRPTVEIGLRRPFWLPWDWSMRPSGWTNDDVVVVDETGEGWDETLAHELVHWNAKGYWTTLPAMIEEGLAIYLSRLVPGSSIQVDPPTDEWLTAALTMTWDDHYAARRQRDMGTISSVQSAGVWVVLAIGMPGLRALAERAEEEGLETIPEEWLRESLPEERNILGAGRIPGR